MENNPELIPILVAMALWVTPQTRNSDKSTDDNRDVFSEK